MASRWCLGGILVVFRWCPGWCLGGISVMFWWYRGIVVVSWCHLDGVLVVSRLCLGGVLVVSWCLGRVSVSVVSWWYLGVSWLCLGFVLVVSGWYLLSR